MASNGSVLGQGIAPVLAAYQQTIQPGLGQAQKAEALQFLEQFQKSVSQISYWRCHLILMMMTTA